MSIAMLRHLMQRHQAVRDMVADLAIAQTHLELVRSLYREALGAWVCESCGQAQQGEAYNQTPDGVHLCDACAEQFQSEAAADPSDPRQRQYT
ncbi:MAG: hypothetical protein V1806_07570 [Pseudomonadota bacterium]